MSPGTRFFSFLFFSCLLAGYLFTCSRVDGAHSGKLALFCYENVNCDIVTVTKGGKGAVCDPDSPCIFFPPFHHIASYSDFMVSNQCPTHSFTWLVPHDDQLQSGPKSPPLRFSNPKSLKLLWRNRGSSSKWRAANPWKVSTNFRISWFAGDGEHIQLELLHHFDSRRWNHIQDYLFTRGFV